MPTACRSLACVLGAHGKTSLVKNLERGDAAAKDNLVTEGAASALVLPDGIAGPPRVLQPRVMYHT
jgi:hypothetical protein